MATPKIIRFFLKLKKKERKEFKRLLKNHTFERDRSQLGFLLFDKLERLESYYGTEKLIEMNSEELASKVYKKEQPSENERRKRFTFLLKQMTNYFLLKKAMDEQDELLHDQLLLTVYKERGLDKLAHQLAENKIKDLEVNKSKNATVYQQLADLQYYQYSYPRTNQNREKRDLLEKIHENQDLAESLKKLQSCCSQLMRGIEYQTETEEKYLHQTKELIKVYELEEHPLIKMYLQAIAAMSCPSKEEYGILRKMFDEQRHLISQEDRNRFLKYLMSLSSILNLKSGEKDYFLEQIYDLYHISFSEQVFMQNNYLNATLFINYVVISIDYRQFLQFKKDNEKLEELPNLHEIVNNSFDKLYHEDRELTERLATAYLFYYKPQYKRALKEIDAYMQCNTYRTAADKLHIRTLRLRIYFEEGHVDKVLTWGKAFLKFLKDNRSGFSHNQVKSHENFVYIAKDLINKKLSKKAALKKINQTKLLTCRNWLKIQATQLDDGETEAMGGS